MYNKSVLEDLTNAQQPNINEQQPNIAPIKLGLFANNAHTSNTCSEKKPSLFEMRKKKLTLDGISMEVATSALQLPPELERNLFQKRAADYISAFNRDVSECVEYYKSFEVINPTNSFNMLPGDKDRYDPMHWAAINNDLNALSAFIYYEVINTVDQRGRNALYFAAACGHVDSIKYLLERDDAKAQLEVLYDDLRHGYQMLIPEILNIDGVKDITGVKDFLSSHKEYNQCLGL